jgi:hypothetical protein
MGARLVADFWCVVSVPDWLTGVSLDEGWDVGCGEAAMGEKPAQATRAKTDTLAVIPPRSDASLEFR